jgi:hypothetical protein
VGENDTQNRSGNLILGRQRWRCDAYTDMILEENVP